MSRFDHIAKEWDHSQTRISLAQNIAEGIINTHQLPQEGTLLDFGAGTGLLTRHLCPHVKAITALDLSEKMLDQLQHNAASWPSCQISIAHCDILAYQNDQAFDGIVSSMSMHHVQDLQHLFDQFAQLLKPRGFLAIADLEKEDGTFHSDGNEGVYHFGFEHKALQDIAQKSGFTQISFKHVHTVIKEDGTSYPIFLMSAQRL